MGWEYRRRWSSHPAYRWLVPAAHSAAYLTSRAPLLPTDPLSAESTPGDGEGALCCAHTILKPAFLRWQRHSSGVCEELSCFLRGASKIVQENQQSGVSSAGFPMGQGGAFPRVPDLPGSCCSCLHFQASPFHGENVSSSPSSHSMLFPSSSGQLSHPTSLPDRLCICHLTGSTAHIYSLIQLMKKKVFAFCLGISSRR